MSALFSDQTGRQATAPASYIRLKVLESRGFVVLQDYNGQAIPEEEWNNLEYLNWKSGGDTNFAPIASALGKMDCAGFWEHNKPDKNGVWTKNAERCPTLVEWTKRVGANFGRARVIKLDCNSEAQAIRNLHLDDNNRLNPAGEGWVVRAWLQLTDDPRSHMLLRGDKNLPSAEARVSLQRGRQFVIDSQRIYHATWHPGPGPRFALIVSFESGPALQRWIDSQLH
jgi:hypothetical protein